MRGPEAKELDELKASEQKLTKIVQVRRRRVFFRRVLRRESDGTRASRVASDARANEIEMTEASDQQ